eukprot:6862034-Prymnesium_polylepis.1
MGRVRQPDAACRSVECTACLLRCVVWVAPPPRGSILSAAGPAEANGGVVPQKIRLALGRRKVGPYQPPATPNAAFADRRA